MISCINLANKDYILYSKSYECFTADYYYYSYNLVLPILILWVVIIPLYFFSILYKNRNNLDSIDTSLKYGLLFKEYHHHSYFWELL